VKEFSFFPFILKIHFYSQTQETHRTDAPVFHLALQASGKLWETPFSLAPWLHRFITIATALDCVQCSS